MVMYVGVGDGWDGVEWGWDGMGWDGLEFWVWCVHYLEPLLPTNDFTGLLECIPFLALPLYCRWSWPCVLSLGVCHAQR